MNTVAALLPLGGTPHAETVDPLSDTSVTVITRVSRPRSARAETFWGPTSPAESKKPEQRALELRWRRSAAPGSLSSSSTKLCFRIICTRSFDPSSSFKSVRPDEPERSRAAEDSGDLAFHPLAPATGGIPHSRSVTARLAPEPAADDTDDQTAGGKKTTGGGAAATWAPE